MILEEKEILRRKTAMVLFALERAFGSYLLRSGANLSDFDQAIVGSIQNREAAKGHVLDCSTAESFLASCYFEDLLQLAEKKGAGTSDAQSLSVLRQRAQLSDLQEIRNACAHPMRSFVHAYWYRIAAIAADPEFLQIGVQEPLEALVAAEQGLISDPPPEWIAQIRWVLPNNLPDIFDHSTTGLVGRSKVTQQLLALLENQRIGTIAIVARGGVGKTAIALDALRTVSLSPKGNIWCDCIVYVSMKTEALTAHGLIDLTAAQTIEELKDEICSVLSDMAGGRPENNFAKAVESLASERVVLCIDNLETLLRDDPDAFVEFNSLLPAKWRVLITSRVRIDGANTLPINDLDDKDALVLAMKYSRARGFPLPDSIAEKVAKDSKKNPLAMKLTIDRAVLGDDISESSTVIAEEIAQFSYDRLIDSLSDSALKALEVVFLFNGVSRADIISALETDADSVAESIGELAGTSLVTREVDGPVEVLRLNDSVREYLQVNSKNLQFRRDLELKLRKAREIRAQSQARQEAKGIGKSSSYFVPAETPEALADLVYSAFSMARNKKKGSLGGVGKLIQRFGKLESEYKNYEIFWRAFGRLLISFDNAKAEAVLLRGAEIDPSGVQCRALLADLYSLQGRHDAAIHLFEQLISEGCDDAAAIDEQLCVSVNTGLLRSMLYSSRYQEVIDRTEGWRTRSIFSEEEAALRIGALRQINGGYSEPLLIDAIGVFDEALTQFPTSSSLLHQGIKLYKDVARLMTRSYSPEFVKVAIYGLIKSLGSLIAAGATPDEGGLDIHSMLEKAKSVSSDLANELDDAVKKALGVSEKHKIVLERNGYKVVRIYHIPETDRGFSKFVFAKDDDEQQYFVHENTLLDAEPSEWAQLRFGSQLVVKPAPKQADGKPLRSLETLIA